VAYYDNGAYLGQTTLDAQGVASLTASLPAGVRHSVIAYYSGDPTHYRSSNMLVIDATGTPTGIALIDAAVVPANSFKFTAWVANLNSPGASLPVGQVRFLDGTTTIGTAPIGAQGLASTTIALDPRQTHSISAVFDGDATHIPSGSNTVTISTTTTTVTSSATGTVSSKTPITVTAKVRGPGATGTVVFHETYNHTLTDIVATVNASGVATLPQTLFARGNHVITATYKGDATHMTSASNSLTVSTR
jgi:hypothetical protein